MVDGGEPGVDSRDEGKHTGRNDLLFCKCFFNWSPVRNAMVSLEFH